MIHQIGTRLETVLDWFAVCTVCGSVLGNPKSVRYADDEQCLPGGGHVTRGFATEAEAKRVARWWGWCVYADVCRCELHWPDELKPPGAPTPYLMQHRQQHANPDRSHYIVPGVYYAASEDGDEHVEFPRRKERPEWVRNFVQGKLDAQAAALTQFTNAGLLTADGDVYAYTDAGLAEMLAAAEVGAPAEVGQVPF